MSAGADTIHLAEAPSEPPVPPRPPDIEQFGLTQASLARLPHGIFGPLWETSEDWFPYFGVLLAVLWSVISGFRAFDNGDSLLGIIGLLTWGFIFGFFGGTLLVGLPTLGLIAVAQKIEKGLFWNFSPRWRKYETFRRAQAQYDLEVKRYKTSLAKREERYWRSLTGPQFEDEVGELFNNLGYSVQLTPATNDVGVDLVLRREGEVTVVQCKAHAVPVPPSVLRELYGSMIHFKADHAILACLEGVTKRGLEFIRGKPIEVYDLKRIIALKKASNPATR